MLIAKQLFLAIMTQFFHGELSVKVSTSSSYIAKLSASLKEFYSFMSAVLITSMNLPSLVIPTCTSTTF